MSENRAAARHTPGPWHITEYCYGKRGARITRAAVKAASGHYITTKVGASRFEGGEHAANAALIAAAPDLLTALVEIVYAWDCGDDAGYNVRAAIDDSRRIIAKAKGEATP